MIIYGIYVEEEFEDTKMDNQNQ